MDAIAFLDFDHSLLESANTDVIIFEKLLPSILDERSDEEEYRSNGDWNGLMNMRFQKLNQSKITKEAIIRIFEECLLTESAINYLKLFYENNVPVHIISDSNTLFISTILKASGVDHMITAIHTNPHSFDGDQLLLGRYHNDSQCEIESCPRNICKGRAVKDILSQLPHQPKIKIYVGDGGNDYCPVKTTFTDRDIIFAKKNYPLHKKLKSDEEIKAAIIEWTKSNEILDYLQSNVFQAIPTNPIATVSVTV